MLGTVSDPIATGAPMSEWHAQDPETALAALGTSRSGLSERGAAERLAIAGPNVTGGSRGERWMTLLLRQVANPLIVVLLVSGAVAIALGDLVDGAVVLGVVAANTLIGFLQEWRAGRAIEALGSMIPDEATVVRDGRRRTVAGCRRGARRSRGAGGRRARPRRRPDARRPIAGDRRVAADGRVAAGRQGDRARSRPPRRSRTARASPTAARW